MRLPIPCMKCQFDTNAPQVHVTVVGFTDDGVYETICDRGHQSLTILQQQKFEILFEIGANAILDGYYREAVTSFSSSLEQFYKFATDVLLFEHSVSESAAAAAWKSVSSQSERQLGAYIFLWLLHFGKSPPLLGANDTRFRNDVVHKGKIPTRARALDFGNAILTLLDEQIGVLVTNVANSVHEATWRHLRRARGTSTQQPATMCLSTAVSLSAKPPAARKPLENYILDLQTSRAALLGAHSSSGQPS